MFLLVFIPITLCSQHSVKIDVENVKSSDGHIRIAVYNDSEGFLAFESVYKTSTEIAKKGVTTIYLKNLPSGTYALAVFHDENSNEKLDTNFIGIPKEHIGFSNSKMKTFGPPSFEECSFVLQEDTAIKVGIK